MRQDVIREELKFIIDSMERTNKDLADMLDDCSLHPITRKVTRDLRDYFNPLSTRLFRVHNDLLTEFTQSNLENGHLRELLKKQCECGALVSDAQCEGCTYLEHLEEKENG